MTMEGVWSSVQGCMSPLVSIKINLERIQVGLKQQSRNSLSNITKQLAIV